MFRPSRSGGDSTTPSSFTSSASRISRSRPRSGWLVSRPRNMIVTLTLARWLRKRTDVALLGLVVLSGDLRPELDLLDVDLGLVLAGELGLLLLLVPVLPVVHDPGDRRPGLRRHLDEVEVLPVRVLERLVRRLDPDLRAVLVDQPHLGDPDPLVDPGLRLRRGLGTDEPPRPQLVVTKLFSSSFLNDKTAANSGLLRVLGSLEPLAGRAAPEVRNGCRPCLQASQGSSQFCDQFVEASCRLLAAALAHGERLLGLAVAVDDDVRDLLDLGVADPLADRLVALVDLDAEVRELLGAAPARPRGAPRRPG